MKSIHKILLLSVSILICLFTIMSINNNRVVRTVRSERELREFYNNRYGRDLSTFERILTLPFSILIDGRVYNTRYKYIDDMPVVIEDAVESNEIGGSSTASKDYSKTNIQVEGVDEADIIKTDGDYIYSISENNVIITNVKDPNKTFIESKIYMDSAIPSDLLLYENNLVVISYNNSTSRYYNQNTLVEVYDITNKTNPRIVKSFELFEPYYTSRCIDGDLYVFSSGSLRLENDKVVRKYIEDRETKEINLKDIKYLKNNEKGIQTLIAHLDLKNTNEFNVSSYLVDISNAYVSKNNIYLIGDTWNDDYISIKSIFTFKGVIGFIEDADNYDYESRTKIYKFEIDKNKGVEFDSTTTIKGSIVNQYSLDEKDNHLRIALETDEGTRIAILNEKLKLIGETPKVAEGERMYASRFIGNKAYLVTYRNTDPLFVIDLTDEKNPRVMGELKIPGYSTYLHPYDENHLIGIGMDTEEVINRDSNGKVTSTWVKTKGMKMCLFDVSDITNPKEVSKTTIGDSRTVSSILTNPKALLFSKEKKLLAIPVNNYEDDFSLEYNDEYSAQIDSIRRYGKKYIAEGYFVYNLDLENGFNLKGIINHEKIINNYYYYGNSKLLRGVYIDDNLYTVSEGFVKVNNLDTLKEISSLRIKEN